MQRRKGMRLRGGFKWAAVLIIAVVLVGFDLLSDNASIVNRGMVAGLAVDGSGELIELAAQVILPGSGGSSAGGNDFMIFTSSGKTMQDAIEKLSVAMGVKASLAHCTLVILGEDLLRTRSEAVMKHFIRSPYFADNTLLVAASGRASDVLAAKVPINEVASYHLQRMMQGVQREAGVNASTVKDYFAEYYYIGGASCMPLAVVSDCEYSPVGPGSEGGEGAQLLDLSRTLVTTREGYALALDRDASRGLSFVRGRLNDGTIVFTGDNARERDVVILESKCKLSVEGDNKAVARVKLKVKRNELPTARDGEIENTISLRELKRIEESVRGQIIACFEQCQKADIDIFHIGERLYRKKGEDWRKSQNKLYIRDIEFDAEIQVKVK